MIKAQETKRRQLLKEDKMQEYEKCISESETNFKMKMMAVQQHVLGQLKLQPKDYQMSMSYMQNNPMLKQKLQETQNQALDPLEETGDESKAVLTREDALKCLKRMEEDKMTSIKILMEKAEQEMWTPH